MVSVMQYLPRLKIILQSKLFVTISLIFLIIYILIFTKWITYDTKLAENTTKLSGNILSYMIDGNKLSMLIKAEEKIQVNYYINTLEEKEYLEENLLIGSKVELEGEIKKPYNNTIPNTFNYKEYLYNNQIYITFSADKIEISHQTNFLNQIKSNFMKRIDRVGSSRAYLYALILGEIGYIENDVYEKYQANGTTHLFAVSGMHISAFVLLLDSVLKKIHVKEMIANLMIISFLVFYMFLIGFTPSVLRGGLLYIFLLFNRKLKLNLKTINVLYILFFLLIIINPFYIYQLGFIYSFVTSFGLILFSNKIKGNAFQKLWITSAIAFLFSFPITIYNFYEINLLTILNNVIIVPFVTSLLFPLTLLTFFLPFLDPLLSLGIWVLEGVSHILNLFEINLVVPKINFIFIILYYLGIYLLYKGYKKSIFYLILLIFSYKLLPYVDPNSYVYFLDVGQGDSTLLIGEHQSYALLIDTGGEINFEQEEWEKRNKEYDKSSNMLTFFKSLGLNKLDLLIGTHGDMDHMGEAENIINHFQVDEVLFNQGAYNDLEQNLINTLKEKKIAYAQSKTEFNLGHDKFYLLNREEHKDENDNSLVIYTKLKGIRILLMGDAGVEVETELLEKYNLSNIDILKVGHHGSKTSTSSNFIDKINPKYSIISVGRNNRYGHPNQEVLENLKDTTIYRTDQHGSIMFKINEGKLKIEFCPP